MERQCTGVDAKEGRSAHHFDAPVVEVERIMGCDCFGFKGRKRGCFGFKGGLIVETISDREVGQGADAG